MNRSSQAKTKDADYSNDPQRSDWTIVTRILTTRSSDFVIGHIDWSTYRGEAQRGIGF